MIRLKVSNAGSSLRLMAAVVAALLFANSDSAMAGPLKLSNYLIFSETDLTTSSNAIGGNIYSSGNINGNATVTGNATAVGNISNNLTVSGTETSGTSSLGALDSNASVLALLGSHVTFTGNHQFTAADPAGTYYVTGNVSFAPGVHGNWTIISDGDINAGTGGAALQVISFIAPNANFPDGLAFYSADHNITVQGNVDVGGGITGAIGGGNVNLNTGSDIARPPGTSTQGKVPEPMSLVLLSSGLMGLGALRFWRGWRS